MKHGAVLPLRRDAVQEALRGPHAETQRAVLSFRDKLRAAVHRFHTGLHVLRRRRQHAIVRSREDRPPGLIEPGEWFAVLLIKRQRFEKNAPFGWHVVVLHRQRRELHRKPRAGGGLRIEHAVQQVPVARVQKTEVHFELASAGIFEQHDESRVAILVAVERAVEPEVGRIELPANHDGFRRSQDDDGVFAAAGVSQLRHLFPPELMLHRRRQRHLRTVQHLRFPTGQILKADLRGRHFLAARPVDFISAVAGLRVGRQLRLHRRFANRRAFLRVAPQTLHIGGFHHAERDAVEHQRRAIELQRGGQ